MGGRAYARFYMRTRKLLGRGGGGGLYPNLWCVLKEYYCECEGGGGLCQIFLCVIEKKLGRGGGGGYTQIFGVYSKNITASVGGGGAHASFFMRTRKLLRRGGLYPNFWCVLKEYYWGVLC